MIQKHFTTILFFALLFITIKINAQVSIIPKPNDIKYTDGKFSYAKGLDIKVVRGDDGTKRIQKQLIDFVKEKNITVVPFSPIAINLNLLQAATTNISSEGYTLTITPTAISISSSGDAGLFYGMQSLIQLIKKDSVKTLPCLEIKDVPAYSFRGMHLDVTHTFFNASVIKEYLDVMAKLKLNQFHWQLGDAATWNIEMIKNPGLTDKDNFYTQAEIKDIVKYAQDRFINIIPEISLPADTLLQNNTLVLDEVMTLFPGVYIHFGSSVITPETEQYLTSKNKKIISTDNTLSANIMMSYKSSKNGLNMATKGNDVIMAPRQYCSFDYYQDWDDDKKSFSMTFLPIDKAYAFNPVGKVKDSKVQQHILGGQAYVSSEFIKNPADLQYQVFPRLLALAECVWTKNSNKKFADFEKRMKAQKNYFFTEKEINIDMVRFRPKKEK